MLQRSYLHPSGQLPAYEWNFGDVNPPVHAWATIFTYRLEKARAGTATSTGSSALPEAAAELHVVGESQGPQRQQPVRGRLPRARQHRRLRPQRAAADGRPPRAGGRHRLDGAVLPEHARDRDRARARAARVCRHGREVRRALPVDRHGDDARRRRHGMWDEEDGFFYDVLRRPTAPPSGSRSARWSDCCRSARPPSSTAGCCEQYPELAARMRGSSRAGPELRAFIHDPVQRGHGGPAARVDPGRAQAPARARDDARRGRVPEPVRHPVAVAVPRRASVRVRGRRPGVPGRVSAGRVRQRHVRGQLELARTDLDAGQRADHPGAAAVPQLLRRRVHGSNARRAPASR